MEIYIAILQKALLMFHSKIQVHLLYMMHYFIW